MAGGEHHQTAYVMDDLNLEGGEGGIHIAIRNTRDYATTRESEIARKIHRFDIEKKYPLVNLPLPDTIGAVVYIRNCRQSFQHSGQTIKRKEFEGREIFLLIRGRNFILKELSEGKGLARVSSKRSLL